MFDFMKGEGGGCGDGVRHLDFHAICLTVLSEHVCQALRRAETEAVMNNELTRTGQWHGPIPIIRLMHCVVHDEVKPHYICRNQAMT